MTASSQWSEQIIAGEIARQTLAKKCVVLVDNCNWTGYECDVLGVTTDLRIIDVEVKISRADLKADAKKDKWWLRQFSGYAQEEWQDSRGNLMVRQRAIYDKKARHWPPKVWKHYYAMPAEIWRPDLLLALPSSASGVLLVSKTTGGVMRVAVERRATPDKNATRLQDKQVMDIARLANLRMWDAYRTADRLRADAEYYKARAAA